MNVHKVDLLLLNPGGRERIYQSLGVSLAAIEPPVWAGLMATFIREKGYSVEVIDTNALDMGPENTAQHVVELNPLLIAIIVYGHQPSASTQVMPAARELCSAIKQSSPTTKVLLVGGHVAALPEQTLREENVDYVCTGEGPYTLLDLVQALKEKDENLDKVRGLAYWKNSQISWTLPAPLVTALDQEMPGISWDYFPMEKYRAHNWHCFTHLDQRQPYAAIYTTLGCPYHCSFCTIQSPFKSGEKVLGYDSKVNSYRLWDPQQVIAEIDILVNRYGVRNIKIADEMFVLNMKHVMGICDLIIERGYDLNIWAYARVDTPWTPQLVERLKCAGINWLAFGIEAASEKVRKDVSKGFGQDKVYKTIEMVREGGIYVIGNYIFGLPEDDLDTMQSTLDLAIELNCEFANMYCVMAYPGSSLYQLALQENWPLPASWSGYSQHSEDTFPLPTRHLSGSEVLRFRDQAFHKYFENPKYLEMVTAKFGASTANHIREMASFRLKRKYA